METTIRTPARPPTTLLQCALAATLAVGAGCSKRDAASTGAAPPAPPAPADPSAAPARSPEGGGGGGAGGAGSALRSYTLFWTMQKEPAGGVKVGLEVPTAWQETVDGMGGPSYRNNGLAHGPDVVLLPSSGADAKARIEALVGRQYDEAALSTAQREDAADGSSVWISSQRPDGYVDARRFLAAPGDAGVVVCVITLTPTEAARLPELKQVCATARLLP